MSPTPAARILAALAALAAASLGLLGPAAAVQGGGGDDPARRNRVMQGVTGNAYHFNNGWGAVGEPAWSIGFVHDTTLAGDFAGDGRDAVVVRRGNRYQLRPGEWTTYGTAADEAYVGDWDGNGTDTLAVRRGRFFHIRNQPGTGPANVAIPYRRPADVVLAGDWDGDGTDTLAVRRGKLYYLKNTIAGGSADRVIAYGSAGDAVLVGDWDGDGTDTLAVHRGNAYHVKNRLEGGVAEKVITYGRASDAVLVGDWDGDGADTLAVRRGEPVPSPANAVERIAARFGMSVRYDDASNGCRDASLAGCMGANTSYLWMNPRHLHISGSLVALSEFVAYHEIFHALQWRACASLSFPRAEHVADAMASLLHRPPAFVRPHYGYTRADLAAARTILGGRCHY